MLISTSSILEFKPIKNLSEKKSLVETVCSLIKDKTNISVPEKDVLIDVDMNVKINTSPSRKMLLILQKDILLKELALSGFTLRL